MRHVGVHDDANFASRFVQPAQHGRRQASLTAARDQSQRVLRAQVSTKIFRAILAVVVDYDNLSLDLGPSQDLEQLRQKLLQIRAFPQCGNHNGDFRGH